MYKKRGSYHVQIVTPHNCNQIFDFQTIIILIVKVTPPPHSTMNYMQFVYKPVMQRLYVVRLFVWLSHDYGQTPWPIVMTFNHECFFFSGPSDLCIRVFQIKPLNKISTATPPPLVWDSLSESSRFLGHPTQLLVDTPVSFVSQLYSCGNSQYCS